MGALLAELAAVGITLRALPDGRLHALGPLTDSTRTTIRQHRAALLAELAANDPVPEQPDELRRLIGIIAADWPDDERHDALAAALADPADARACYRALVAERSDTRAREAETGTRAPARGADDGLRACTDCANSTSTGRCLAAWRGESFGAGIATSRTWTPAMPDRPQRCGAYDPGPDDHDRRTGRERWPFLFTTGEVRR